MATAQQNYPLTQSLTETSYSTQAYYVTQTMRRQEQITVTETNAYYVTKTAIEYSAARVANTYTETLNSLVTMTVWTTVPEYHTITSCSPMTPVPPPPTTYGTPPPATTKMMYY